MSGPAADAATADQPSVSAAAPRVACPHIRQDEAVADERHLGQIPDPANRCWALGDPIHLSADQQRLVCASSRHTTCRRYVLAATGAAPTAFARPRPLILRPAIVGSLVVLAGAAAVTVAYLAGGGAIRGL